MRGCAVCSVAEDPDRFTEAATYRRGRPRLSLPGCPYVGSDRLRREPRPPLAGEPPLRQLAEGLVQAVLRPLIGQP